MKKMKLMIMAAALLLAAPLTALAGGSHHGSTAAGAHGSYHGKGGHAAIPGQSPAHLRRILKHADLIGLSDSQRKQIGKLLIEAETEAARAHAEAEIAVAAFRSRLHGGKVSDSEVNAYSKRMGELRAARLRANLKASMAASRLLSDQQKAKLYGGRGK